MCDKNYDQLSLLDRLGTETETETESHYKIGRECGEIAWISPIKLGDLCLCRVRVIIGSAEGKIGRECGEFS